MVSVSSLVLSIHSIRFISIEKSAIRIDLATTTFALVVSHQNVMNGMVTFCFFFCIFSSMVSAALIRAWARLYVWFRCVCQMCVICEFKQQQQNQPPFNCLLKLLFVVVLLLSFGDYANESAVFFSSHWCCCSGPCGYPSAQEMKCSARPTSVYVEFKSTVGFALGNNRLRCWGINSLSPTTTTLS